MFRPDPKPLPKPKREFGFKYWSELKAKSHKKKNEKEKSIRDLDDDFYKFCWKHKPHVCAECGLELQTFDRDFLHHILAKSKYPQFRHEVRNIIVLCGRFSCHAKAESAISYPKMKVFKYCEGVKKKLLASIGEVYEKYS